MNTRTAKAIGRSEAPNFAPPLKIQGIKTRLAGFIREALDWRGPGVWIEPFLGSGAVLFNVLPERARVSDLNPHLIGFYAALSSGAIEAGAVEAHLLAEGESLRRRGESHYYALRERFNAEPQPLDFLFLSRACFNGVMRFNRKGEFNVPFCRKPERFSRALVTRIRNQVAEAARRLRDRDWTFAVSDWRPALAAAREGDMVYLDPPYAGRHADYYQRWDDAEALALGRATRELPCRFAASAWIRNRYRENPLVGRDFGHCRLVTREHFYHVGSRVGLRHPVVEGLFLGGPPGRSAGIEVDAQRALVGER